MDLIPGQYVTYLLERPDGVVALRLEVAQPLDDGGFLVLGTAREGAAVTRSAIAVSAAADGPVRPLGFQLIEGDEERDARLPMMHAPLFLNLLSLRARATPRTFAEFAPMPVRLPGVAMVTPIEDPWPEFGYIKRHDLSQRVPITGVARSLIADREPSCPLTVTAFGCNNPQAGRPGVFEDFLDLEHRGLHRRRGYSIKHPATWFLEAIDPKALPERWTEASLGTHGGTTCCLSLLVTTFEGDKKRGLALCSRQIELAKRGPQSPGERILTARFDPGGSGRLFGYRTGSGPIEDLFFTAIAATPGGRRVASARASLSVLRDHPRRAELTASCAELLPRIVASFRFL